MRNFVQFARRGQIASKGLFYDHARVFGEFSGAEAFDHGLKKRGWNCQIVRRSPRLTEHIFDRCKRAGVFIVTTYILEQRERCCNARLLSIPPDRFMLSVTRVCKRSMLHLGKATPMTGTLRAPFFYHCIECREDHLVGQIACRTEDH